MISAVTIPVIARSLCGLVVLVVVSGAACSRDPHAAMLEFTKSGDAFATAGKLQEAIIEYRNAVQQEPRAGDVRVKLAETYIRQGDLAKAIEEYVRAAAALPAAAVQAGAGNLLLVARRFDEAKARAEKALEVEAKNVEAQILLGNALAGMKNLDGAVTELEQAIESNPDRGSTYASLGAMELQRGNRAASEKAFKRAVDLGPHTAAPHLALGGFYWATSQWPDAERELTEALNIEPDNSLAHRAAATFFVVTNRAARAEEHLRRVVEITGSPDS